MLLCFIYKNLIIVLLYDISMLVVKFDKYIYFVIVGVWFSKKCSVLLAWIVYMTGCSIRSCFVYLWIKSFLMTWRIIRSNTLETTNLFHDLRRLLRKSLYEVHLPGAQQHQSPSKVFYPTPLRGFINSDDANQSINQRSTSGSPKCALGPISIPTLTVCVAHLT